MQFAARLRVRLDIALSRAFGYDTPEAHLHLADRYYYLAALEEKAGHHAAAARHRRVAEHHVELGPPPDLPPAAAMAMPVPRPPELTDARAK